MSRRESKLVIWGICEKAVNKSKTSESGKSQLENCEKFLQNLQTEFKNKQFKFTFEIEPEQQKPTTRPRTTKNYTQKCSSCKNSCVRNYNSNGIQIDSDCVNLAADYECNPSNCSTLNCQNREVQKDRPNEHKLVKKFVAGKGNGLFTTSKTIYPGDVLEAGLIKCQSLSSIYHKFLRKTSIMKFRRDDSEPSNNGFFSHPVLREYHGRKIPTPKKTNTKTDLYSGALNGGLGTLNGGLFLTFFDVFLRFLVDYEYFSRNFPISIKKSPFSVPSPPFSAPLLYIMKIDAKNSVDPQCSKIDKNHRVGVGSKGLDSIDFR